MKNHIHVLVVGGGWAGCSAAITAAKSGAKVTLIERTDMLLGTGLVGGIFRNNGRFTAAEEMIALGAGDLFEVVETCSDFKSIEFPGHKHASLYNVYKIEPAVKKHLLKLGINIILSTQINKLEIAGNKIASLTGNTNILFNADVFVDATGTSAVPGNCIKHGNGCAMCILRCHSFGPRLSLSTLAKTPEVTAQKADGSLGAMSGSCKLFKESLSLEIQSQLDNTGVCIIPLPEHIKRDQAKLSKKACQQYALPEFADNIILLNTGPAKLMTAYYPLSELRTIPGFECARYEDPIAGGKGNSMRYFNFAKCDINLKAQGNIGNLFCAGERTGSMVGHTEAIVTGALAGHNAVRQALGKQLLSLPTTLAVGDFINYVLQELTDEKNLSQKYTFSGSVYFDRMCRQGLYSTDIHSIQAKVAKENMTNIFSKPLQN